MATRKRRPPEKRQSGRVSRLVAGGASMIGSAAMRNPVATGGTTIFAIVFSFIAANALWYQPSAHPHPWLDTRDAFRNYAAHAMHGGANAVTYRIERDQKVPPQAASAPAAAPAAAPANPPASVASVIVHDDTAVPPAAASPPADGATDLVSQIQANLARRGLYDGTVDGVMGPKTAAAIMFYQETRGLTENGQPDAALLDLLKKDNSEFNVIPPDRPSDVTGAIAVKPKPKPADPVAALIAKAPRTTTPVRAPVPPAPITVAAATPAAKDAAKEAAKSTAADKPVSSDLVKMIQKGLSNLAYRDVSVDGVAGQQTKDAIRHFEKHYRLPITGEPNEAVLDKLKKIGAL